MMPFEKICAAELNDADLVAESLAGGREAFRQIVERHQTLVCSLAYCATGSLTQSEDLAQETFLAAWRQLAELREPSKLRPWLCGIARFIICNELRRQGREPVHDAETLEAVNELAAPEPLPSERAMSKEEQAILWHCVARIPEIYREPLVLFYREQKSIERVAEALELSEDAVKQRLARGRKLLQEQALAYVEGALQSTIPSKAFSIGVLAALPLTATSAKALGAGAAVKGSSTAKTVVSMGALGAMILYWSLLGFLAFVGGCAGYWMSRACATSSRQCENVTRFWRTLAVGFPVCFIIRRWLDAVYSMHGWARYHGFGFLISRLSFDLMEVVIVAALAIWTGRWWRESSLEKADTEAPGRNLRRRLAVWLSLGMIGPAFLFVPLLGSTLWQAFGPSQRQQLSDAEAQKIINERQDAYFSVVRENDGATTLFLNLPENDPGSMVWRRSHMPAWWRWTSGSKSAWWNLWTGGGDYSNRPTWLTELIYFSGYRPVELTAEANVSTLKLLNDKKIHYGIGRSRSILGFMSTKALNDKKIHYGIGRAWRYSYEAWPFRSLLPFFIAPMGAVTLLRRIKKAPWTRTAPGISETLERENKSGRMLLALRSDSGTRRVFGIAFTATFLMVFIANALTAYQAFTAMGLYVVLFLGSVKGAFFGLVAGVGVLYLRTQRKISQAGVKI